MKSTFKLSALSLAALLAFGPLVHATAQDQPTKHHKQHVNRMNDVAEDKAEALANNNDKAAYSFLAPQYVNSWDPYNPVPDRLPTNQTQFLSWAEDINGGKSHDPLFNCWNNMLCFSGLLDLDAKWFNRKGNPFGPTGTTSGTGLRPAFGISTSQFVGSINNANAFVDLTLPQLVRIHTNIAYVNGSVITNSYSWSPGADWGSVYRFAAGLHADEIYAVFSEPTQYPVYFKVGRMYLDFGQYSPNGYGLPTVTPSLTQLMTQVRTGGAQLGFATHGLYGSATWSMAQQSLGNFVDPSRNYSAKLGFMREFANGAFNVNVSYLWDLRDTDYMNDTLNYLNTYWAGTFDASFAPLYTIKRQHAFAGHADVKYKSFGLAIEGAAATGPLSTTLPSSSNLWTAGVNANYDFPTFGHASKIDLGYQLARHSRYISGIAPVPGAPFTGFILGPFGNQMPASRIVGTYMINVVRHVNVAAQWVHDQDVGPFSGTNNSSDFAIIRLDLEI